jgi:hypothetical protein
VYDALEREYISLAKKLSKTPTATNMVGFDKERPACLLVQSKIKRQGRNFMFTINKESE